MVDFFVTLFNCLQSFYFGTNKVQYSPKSNLNQWNGEQNYTCKRSCSLTWTFRFMYIYTWEGAKQRSFIVAAKSSPGLYTMVHLYWKLIIRSKLILGLSPASKASREVAYLTERKNLNTPVYAVKEFVCLSVINFDFDPNYLRTGKNRVFFHPFHHVASSKNGEMGLFRVF